MPIASPKVIDSEGTEKDSGGGQAATNSWRDWTELSLNPSDWTVIHGTGTAGKSATVAKVGDFLQFDCPLSPNASIEISQTDVKGTFLIAPIHLKPWNECGIQKPSGVDDHDFYPEAFSLKVEMELESPHITGPGGGSTGSYGRYCQAMVGLVHYASDQSGSPVLPTANGYTFAKVYKKGTGNPDNDNDDNNLFSSGFVSWNSAGQAQGARWTGQPSAGAAGHNAIVFQAGIGANSIDSTNRVFTAGGSYATGNAYARSVQSGSVIQQTSDIFSGLSDRYIHIAVAFGAFNSQIGLGCQIKVKKIRSLLQPLSNREAMTAV